MHITGQVLWIRGSFTIYLVVSEDVLLGTSSIHCAQSGGAPPEPRCSHAGISPTTTNQGDNYRALRVNVPHL